MKKLLHLVFLLSFYFGFSQSEEEYSSFHFELGSHQKILVSNTKVRKFPELGTVVIDSLSPGNDIKIIYRTPQNFKIGERHAPWFKVSYEKNGTPTEGYIWGGNIALGHRKYNDVQLLFGIASTQKIKNKGSEGDYNEMIARVVALKDNQVISERNFEMGNSENLSGYGFKIIENQKLKNELVVAQKKVNAANLQLDDKQRTIIMQWFMYGGGVLGVGLILGLVLPHLVPSRKRKDRWMN